MFRTNQATTRNLLLCVSATLTSIAGCGELDSTDESASEIESDDEIAGQNLALQSDTLRDPSGSYFANVRANGTGCPSGSWDTSISSDGKTFTTTFNKYIAEVSPSKSFEVKDCTLGIKLHSPQGLSFAIQKFEYSGYALLEKGVNLRQVSTIYFQGNASDGAEGTTELVGPQDRTFVFSDQVSNADLVWSPCGVERDLNVRTTLRLQNAKPGVAGYANLAATDGSTKLAFKLAWKACKPASTTAAKDDAKAAAPAAKTPATTTKPATTAKPSSSASDPFADFGAIIEGIFGGLGGLGGGPVIIGTERS